MKTMVMAALAVCAGVCVAVQQLELGRPAPAFSAAEWINCSGPLSLTQPRDAVVVVCFFSTVEERSLRAVFEMKRMQQHFAKQGVTFVALTDQDRVKGHVDRFVTRHKITFPVGTGSPSRNQYFVAQGSYAFIVDRAGKLVWKGAAEQGLQAGIELALNRAKGETAAAKEPRRETRAAVKEQAPAR